jgi:hypothetical protein
MGGTPGMKTENLSNAAKNLKGLSGIYSITCLDNGCMYIGSSVDMGGRLADHLVYGSSNTHLLSHRSLWASPFYFCSSRTLKDQLTFL